MSFSSSLHEEIRSRIGIQMKNILSSTVVVSLVVSGYAFAPSQISSSEHSRSCIVSELKLHPDQALELEEAARQWLDTASKMEDEQNDLVTKKPDRALGTPLLASGSANKARNSKWWSRAFNRLVRRNIAGHH
jgi:hypothetical protein